MTRWKTLLLVLALLPLVCVQAQERRDPKQYIQMLESERRVEALQIDRVVETLKVVPGLRIADIGAGSGLFSRPLARKVGEKGVVYAIDIDAELLKHIADTARQQSIANIRTVLCAEDDPKIPEPVDLIVIIDTLHHIKNQAAYLKGLRRYLRPECRVAIIDFTESWPPGHEQMRFSVADLEGWMKAAEFKLVEKHSFLDNNFFVIFQ
jgi:cyclopropane fatty-acyl-phospholipid synthase-like methyltransferase